MSSKLSKAMMSIIEEKVGIPYDEMKTYSFEEIDKFIEKKNKRRLKFEYEPGHSPRGNILIQLKRLVTIEETNKKFKKYFHV